MTIIYIFNCILGTVWLVLCWCTVKASQTNMYYSGCHSRCPCGRLESVRHGLHRTLHGFATQQYLWLPARECTQLYQQFPWWVSSLWNIFSLHYCWSLKINLQLHAGNIRICQWWTKRIISTAVLLLRNKISNSILFGLFLYANGWAVMVSYVFDHLV